MVAGALLLTATLAFAQGPGRRGFHRPMFGAALSLTDAQKAQIKEIRGDARTANKPYFEQMKTLRTEQREAVKAGKSEAELRNLAQNAATVSANIHANQLVAQARTWQVLTPEQQQKLEEGRTKMRERSKARSGKRFGQPRN